MDSFAVRPFILGLGLIGVFFNIRMLRLFICVDEKALSVSLRRLRPFVICQFIFQVAILCTNSMEAWNGLDYVRHRQSSSFKKLNLCICFLVAFNLITIAVLFQSRQSPRWDKRSEISARLFANTSIALGCIGSTVLWLQSHDFLPLAIIVSIMVFYFLLVSVSMSLADAMIAHQDNEKAEQSSVCTQILAGRKTRLFVAVWVALNFALTVALLLLPGLSRDVLGEQNTFLLMSSLGNSVTGILLPLGFIGVFTFEWDKFHDQETTVLIV